MSSLAFNAAPFNNNEISQNKLLKKIDRLESNNSSLESAKQIIEESRESDLNTMITSDYYL